MFFQTIIDCLLFWSKTTSVSNNSFTLIKPSCILELQTRWDFETRTVNSFDFVSVCVQPFVCIRPMNRLVCSDLSCFSIISVPAFESESQVSITEFCLHHNRLWHFTPDYNHFEIHWKTIDMEQKLESLRASVKELRAIVSNFPLIKIISTSYRLFSEFT